MAPAALLEEFGPADAREREESWRYSRPALRALAQQPFVAADPQAAVDDPLRERFAWAHTDALRAVFVNGVFSASNSDLSALATVVRLRHAATDRTILTISGDCAEPLHLVYLSLPGAAPSRWSAALDIEATRGNAQLIEHHLGDPGSDVLGALRSRVTVSAGATLRTTTLCDLADSASLYRRTDTVLTDDATLLSTHVLLGGRLQRHDIGVELAGARSRLDSRGVFALRGRQHVDTHMDVRHLARDTACDVLWRGVADERARGIFHGAITVAKGADGADAQLSNKNLLLSALAEIDTQPALEIHADEVKAAHGATVGQLDERALFYLRSRGIGLTEARRMLVAAFAAVALDRVEHAWLRAHLDTLLAPRVGAERA
ncbi:MAG: Fe-S cluster assembly protein SufD [Rudaea sp.]